MQKGVEEVQFKIPIFVNGTIQRLRWVPWLNDDDADNALFIR